MTSGDSVRAKLKRLGVTVDQEELDRERKHREYVKRWGIEFAIVDKHGRVLSTYIDLEPQSALKEGANGTRHIPLDDVSRDARNSYRARQEERNPKNRKKSWSDLFDEDDDDLFW